MIILLVNDDGIKSNRLLYARQILAKYGKVYTVAPIDEQSGKSASITIGKIKYEKISEDFYGIYGTPVDCVNFGIHGLKISPDYVVSGINRGYNIGIDTMYSGTVAAALQAKYFGFKALAFSADYKGENNIVKYFERTLEHIINNNLSSKEYILNINFPKEEILEDFGVEMTRLFYPQVEMKTKLENGFFHHTRNILAIELPEFTDIKALKEGKTSITKIYLK